MDEYTRFLFVHTNRIPESVVTLSFDRFLVPKPTKTYVLYGPDFSITKEFIEEKYNQYGIDTSNFIIQSDIDFLVEHNLHEEYKDIYKFGGWIAQQLFKFVAIDTCKEDHMLIQDCDSFAVKPYHYFNNRSPNVFLTKNEKHSPQYYYYLQRLLNITKQTQDNFVSEFMPITRSLWLSIKWKIKDRIGLDWYHSMLDEFSKDKSEQVWFSEYELIGNWYMHLQKHIGVTFIEQKRCEHTPEKLNLDKHNCLTQIRQLEFEDVDNIIKTIEQKINEQA